MTILGLISTEEFLGHQTVFPFLLLAFGYSLVRGNKLCSSCLGAPLPWPVNRIELNKVTRPSAGIEVDGLLGLPWAQAEFEIKPAVSPFTTDSLDDTDGRVSIMKIDLQGMGSQGMARVGRPRGRVDGRGLEGALTVKHKMWGLSLALTCHNKRRVWWARCWEGWTGFIDGVFRGNHYFQVVSVWSWCHQVNIFTFMMLCIPFRRRWFYMGEEARDDFTWLFHNLGMEFREHDCERMWWRHGALYISLEANDIRSAKADETGVRWFFDQNVRPFQPAFVNQKPRFGHFKLPFSG